jgi:hypothetical protein
LRIDSRQENMGAEACERGRRRHDQARAQTAHEVRGEEGSMTDRRDDERERTRREQEGDERRREHVERRFDDLKESWRRNHPSEPGEGGKGRPRKGRPM